MAVTKLPTELWDRICEYLNKPSVRNLSLTDCYFRSVTANRLFRAISIHANQAAQLQQVLQQGVYMKHIRVLEVYHRFEPTLRDDDSLFTYPRDVFLKRDAPTYYPGEYPPEEVYVNPEDAHRPEPNWDLVADLLRSLPALSDLIWTCLQQLPLCLLRILHDDKRFATCRLHIRNFGLSSLATSYETVDSHELELVQSPNLYSVWFKYDRDDSYNNDDRLPEVVSYATRCLASNLRIVRLRQHIIPLMTPVSGGTNLHSIFARATRLLESILPSHGDKIGRLEQLQFAGYSYTERLDAKQIAGWRDCTDFSALQTLVLDTYITNEVLTSLASCHFASLTDLSLKLEIEGSSMATSARDKERLSDTTSLPARDFLCSIPPLKKLRLTGEFDHSYLRDVIAHHGTSLRTLQLVSKGYSPHRLSLLPSEVASIGHRCQASLKDLRVQMLRSSGEGAACSSLGSIASLQTLHLTLDASDYTALRNDEGIEPPIHDPGTPYAIVLAPPREHFDDFDQEFGGFDGCSDLLDPLRGHFKDMFVNAALDQNLARAIYAKLTSAKDTLSRSIPFDRVDLQTIGGGDFGQGDVQSEVEQLTNELQRRWVVQRNWTSAEEQFTLTELECDRLYSTSHRRIAESESSDRKNMDVRELDPRVEIIFRRLWPAKANGSDWRNDWHSFPLT